MNNLEAPIAAVAIRVDLDHAAANLALELGVGGGHGHPASLERLGPMRLRHGPARAANSSDACMKRRPLEVANRVERTACRPSDAEASTLSNEHPILSSRLEVRVTWNSEQGPLATRRAAAGPPLADTVKKQNAK